MKRYDVTESADRAQLIGEIEGLQIAFDAMREWKTQAEADRAALVEQLAAEQRTRKAAEARGAELTVSLAAMNAIAIARGAVLRRIAQDLAPYRECPTAAGGGLVKQIDLAMTANEVLRG